MKIQSPQVNQANVLNKYQDVDQTRLNNRKFRLAGNVGVAQLGARTWHVNHVNLSPTESFSNLSWNVASTAKARRL